MWCRKVVYVERIDDVYISHIERRGRWPYAICYVKSQRSRELCYQVVVKWRLDMRYLYGRCECLDFKFRGGPCKHIVKAKVAVREYLKKAKEYR